MHVDFCRRKDNLLLVSSFVDMIVKSIAFRFVSVSRSIRTNSLLMMMLDLFMSSSFNVTLLLWMIQSFCSLFVMFFIRGKLLALLISFVEEMIL